MKKFIILLLKFSIPIVLVMITYVGLDPFKVIWQYDSFYDKDNQTTIPFNRDYVSTANFDYKNTTETYDSFIFGNSRSIFYEAAAWTTHLPLKSKPYHFNASGETLYGIYHKILYADAKNNKISNVLIVMDYEVLKEDKSKEGHLYVISPQLVNNTNFIDFHLSFLKAFLSKEFLIAYFDYKLTGKTKSYMKEVLGHVPFTYDATTNEIRNETFETQIANGTFYTPEVMKNFYKRDTLQHYYPTCIKEKQQKMLKEIAAIFKKHKTNCKIIISPLYNQQQLNSKDLNYLKQLFGDKAVHDFSGINSITKDYKNYYENSHYRPHVATAIMNKIYSN